MNTKIFFSCFSRPSRWSSRVLPVATTAILVSGLTFSAAVTSQAEDAGHAFGTPEQAVAALAEAVSNTNRPALALLFGSAVKQLVNPDEVQGAAEFAEFATAMQSTNRLVHGTNDSYIMLLGENDWLFPIPLVKQSDGWRFDTAAGLEELLNRRIGRNELDVLRVMRAYVQAQREYASRDRDGDEVLEYAQQLLSSLNKMDGLYWPLELSGEMSPLGPLVAYAQGEGYTRDDSAPEKPQPFHGYFFKLLKSQGKNAPGGKYDYVINGNMIGGFALVAWPAEYGESGIMTFIVNQQGRVYQRDLGEKTAKTVKKLTTYDPDKNWQASTE